MKLIIGLGNPGEKYLNTRHNVGYLVIDKLSQILNTKPQILNKFKIFKSKNFMNESGEFVKKVLADHRLLSADDLYIVHDDLDLPLGTWKIQYAKGPKDNGGINSIEQILGTKDFWRVRVGIENRGQRLEVSGENYVLQEFSDEEKKILDKAIDKLLINLIDLISK